MIIVSQDKTEIINFDKLAEIVVCDTVITITDGIQQERGLEIGKYKTEQRAKEVLEQIVKAYQASEFYKVSNTDIQASMVETYEKNRTEPFKYEMPTE